ncbi:probable aspartic proteinase GIP2 [Rutidosis leptorrhynchoides]|uniref:probable aspartic proteinase GIP2 n=1 Tax=Rutidosis leptorrhynchoides TaxID=125765 RepID=UPI003A99F9F1
MVSSQTILTTFSLFFSFVTFSNAALNQNKLPKNTAIHFPIIKNQTSNLYYTTFEFGTPSITVDALVDLGGQNVWFDTTSFVSSSYKRAPCNSNRCKNAKGFVLCNYMCESSPTPGCSTTDCIVFTDNPVINKVAGLELGDDTMKVTSTNGTSVSTLYEVPKFQFTRANADMVRGLPGDHTKGLAGLARNNISLTSQVSSSFKLAPKFAICLPSSSENGLGDIFIGGGPYYMPPSTQDQSLSLVRTPLLVNPVTIARIAAEGDTSDEYFIGVKDIEINGKRVSVNSTLLSFDTQGIGGTKLSTIARYTVLHASIYKRLVKDYVKAATLMKIKRVTSVAPFGACFDSNSVSKTLTGPAVPDIDLVLQAKIALVKFKLSGSNLMVEAKKNVICLAIIDGGAEPLTSIVIGGHQLENRLLEFDLSTSLLGFTPSLLLLNTSCSHYR